MEEKSKKNEREHLDKALIVILFAIAVSLYAFKTADNKITGFATFSSYDAQASLKELNDINSLRSLAPGSYYVDDNGIVYWLDDSTRPAVAKLNFISNIQINTQFFIDDNGNIEFI